MGATTIRDIDNLILGESSEPVDLTTSAENRLAALALVRQASMSLDIVSRELEPPVYDDLEIIEAIKELVLGSRKARVRILIRDISRIVKQGHRLVELCRRLPSFMEIRVPAKEHENYNSAFLVADRKGMLFRIHADRYRGTVNFADRQGADDLTRLFEEMWEPAEVPPDLRTLSV